MEGNDIEDLGGGSFRTVAAVQRYSLLDQYAMGLVPETAVPPFFYVESPVNMSASRTRESAPEAGVTFNGTRRDVLIQDIIAINGAARSRRPRSRRGSTARHSSTSCRRRQQRRPRAGRQARSDPPRVGRILPAGDRRPDARRDDASVALRPAAGGSSL